MNAQTRTGTLTKWAQKYGRLVSEHTSGALYVDIGSGHNNLTGHETDERWELFHLTDYAVSSVSGPIYWLTPIAEAKPIDNTLSGAMECCRTLARLHYGSTRHFNEDKMLAAMLRRGFTKQHAINAIIKVSAE